MISVVVAAYNEEKRLPATLRRTAEYFGGHEIPFEIIVVDDGSTDRTSSVSRELGVHIPQVSTLRYDRNRGKGHALRVGVLESRGDMVLFTDADLSTPIEELSRMAPLLDSGCDVVIGSRALELSRIVRRQPWWRQGMGRTFNRIVRLFVLDGFSDTQCGFKLFRGDVARLLFGLARIDRFAFDVEILALALKRGYRVGEIPVTWVNSPASTVRPLWDSLLMLRDLARIRRSLGGGQHWLPTEAAAGEKETGCCSWQRS